MPGTSMRRAISLVGGTALLAAALGSVTTAQSDAPVTLTYSTFVNDPNPQIAQALADAYTALHPNVTIDVVTRPGGAEGDNLVKTALATDEMEDVFMYNAGSLLQALSPTEQLVDLSAEPCIPNIAESFIPAVTQGAGIFGVPVEPAMGGGILYNKKIYEQLSLAVPTTWAEFGANNEAIKAAGIAPVGATYGDTWTSQLFVLADYYNVQSAIPDFADDYTGNKIKYATTPAALAGFQHLQEGFDKGWYQKDFGSAKFDDGLNMLAAGEVAHYPMLTFALAAIAANNPDKINDIGFFAQPGDDATKNGATVWMPAALYIPQSSTNIDVAKDFLCFVASVAGTEAMQAAVPPSGPYLIKGSTLPADALPAVLDLQKYLDTNMAAPALEFVSPVKGPSLEQITVEVGSGLRSAEDGAALYDQDIEKQAKQLGLPGW